MKKRKFQLLITTALIALIVTLAYPYGKEMIGMVHTYSTPENYGKEVMYSYINKGDKHAADEALQNIYEINRYQPVKFDNITWQEDPYSDLYWRLGFYDLEPVRNLLYAWEETGKSEYKDKAIEITNSFLDNGMNGPYSWDYHGAAFRTMTLINLKAKLKEKNQLPTDLDNKIQAALKVHGDFLADPAHFEKEYNHGLDQAAALYLLSINYSDMDGAKGWLKLSSERMVSVLNGIIDEDGVLVENSPYYHLYVLEKFYEIKKFLQQNNLKIKGFPDVKLDKMITYAVYMLQPDSNVPTIGASIRRPIGLDGIFKELAVNRPDLLYVLSQGVYGLKPDKLNIQFPEGGETIMRSGWGRKDSFTNQTQLIFDVGNYRTNHSDLDALSFNLFGNGFDLMPDGGLYSYAESPYRTFFHGTKSHNTVVVDGQDQGTGNDWMDNSVKAGKFKEGSGYAYQSGESKLYEGVTHERAIAMIEDSTILIFDNLKSDSEHTYEQLFHLFPEAQVSTDGLILTAKGSLKDQSLTIKQFVTDGVELRKTLGQQNPPDGLCSFELNQTVPCYDVSYAQRGKNVSYVTSISLGSNNADIAFDRQNNLVTVNTLKGSYKININETENKERTIEANKKGEPNENFTDLSLGNFKFVTPSNGSVVEQVRMVDLDLSNRNLRFKIKADGSFNLKDIDLTLSNNNWRSVAKYNINHIIDYQHVNREGEWLEFGVGKSDTQKDGFGGWVKKPNFDWSKIDGIKFALSSKPGSKSTVNIEELSLAPDQDEPKAVIIFDDGWSSVLKAAREMNKYGMKGNIGVITGSIGTKNYLSLDEIKDLQDKYGWSIASHSNLHKDAIAQYEKNNNLSGLDKDISDALQYMIKNKINSAPNWYIYPDGSTDEAVKNIVGKYYKFGRATTSEAVSFPFADPLEVGIFPVNGNDVGPQDVHNAVSDAVKYHNTILLMFHKITDAQPAAPTEISMDDFKAILEDLNNQGIKVDTLSELDRENNIPETEFTLHPAAPTQIDLNFSPSFLPINFNFVINKIWGSLKSLL